MDKYHEYMGMVKGQLKGHFLFLYGWLLLLSILISVLQNVGVFLGDDLVSSLIALCLSLLCVIINTTLLFLYIQRVRGITFRKKDIRYSFSKAGVQIVIGLLLSIVQLLVQIAASVLIVIPILYMLISAFISLLFVCWYALVAFLIYDQELKMQNLFTKPFAILKQNASLVFLAGGFYILWYVISQISLSMLMQQFLSKSDTLENALLSLVKAADAHAEIVWIAAGIGIVYFLVQYLILTVLYLVLANLYERERQLV